jgi:hypothetical protein
MITIHSELVSTLLAPYQEKDIERIVVYGHRVFLQAEDIIFEDRTSEKLCELEKELSQARIFMQDLQEKLRQQQQSSVEACIEKIAESAVVKELTRHQDLLEKQLIREYQSKVELLEFKEKKFTEEVEFLKNELSKQMTSIETSVRSSLEPFNKKATSAEKGQLGEQISSQWFEQLYPGTLIEDTHSQEGYGDIHLIFPSGTRIMVESKNVQRSQRTKDCGKFVKNALQLFNEGKIHGAVYQSHNNEDTTHFPGMEHNPGIVYLDKEKKLMVAVLIGSVCTKENTALLVNILLDHIRSNKLNVVQTTMLPESSGSSTTSNTASSSHVSLKEAYRTGMRILTELEINKEFYREQMKLYGERLSICMKSIEEARYSLLEIKSSAPPYFFEEKDFVIESGKPSSEKGVATTSGEKKVLARKQKDTTTTTTEKVQIDAELGEQIALKVHPCRNTLFDKSSSMEKTFLRSFLKSNEQTKSMTMKELEVIHNEMCSICLANNKV